MNKLSIATFTNLGYWAHSRRFEPIETDLSGSTALVTGSTGGIGLETARQLSALGARVLVVGRDPEKLDEAVAGIDGPVRGVKTDLSSMAEIEALAEEVSGSEEVSILVNNVGVLLPEHTTTAEGLETSFATNLAGHFLLTNLLLPRMPDGGRVVNVSSGGMYSARISLRRLQPPPDRYDGTAVYAQTKRAQVILTEMWADKLDGTTKTVHAMHPGWVETAGVAYSLPTFNKVMGPFLRNVGQGADTVVWLSAAQEPADDPGGFWFDRRQVPTHLDDRTRETPADRMALWRSLVDVTGSDLVQPTTAE